MTTTINASTSAGLISSADTSGILQLQTANTAALTIDASQNVGVGTASPDAKLTVSQTSTPADLITLKGANSVTGALGIHALGNGGVYLQASSTRDIRLRIGSTDYATLDSVGNFGLGVTPQTWNSGYKVLQFSSGGALYGATGDVYLGNNVYANSADSNTYITTNFASMYRQNGGKHIFYTSASGTAGASISFTEALTLQNVSQANLTLRGTNASMLLNSTNGVYPSLFLQTSGTSFGQLGGDGTNVNIGATGYLAFQTNGIGSEKARITTAGEFLLTGLTSPISSGILCIANNLNNNNPIVLKNTTTQGPSQTFVVFLNSSNGQAGGIFHSGSTSVTYSTSSDARLKTDLGVAVSTNVIDNTIIHDYEWKEDKKIDRGVFAQEAYEVKPSAVAVGNDELTEDGNLAKPWGVDYSKYVPDLIVHAQQLKKQVQEQQAIIQQLQADVAALKGTP